MQDTIFHKILKQEIPSFKVYEDENTYAFLDINPVNKGHVLVIPKKYSQTFLEMDDSTCNKMMVTVRNIGKAVKQATNADSVSLLVIGEDVPYTHFHIVPRFSEDKKINLNTSEYGEGEAQSIQSKIVSFI